jgi:SagB-type dehydrogenase family enzyme
MFAENRGFLKSPINSPADLVASDQDQGIEAPASQKPYPEDVRLIDLITPDEISLGKTDLVTALRNRRSIRKYSEEKLTLEELSFLLWSVQGIQRLSRNESVTYRTVPASGGIHPFETYLVIFRVENIQPGLYRYLALEHKLLLVNQLPPDFQEELAFACRGQNFVSKSAVVFIWTAVPYRTEWRYANEAHKAIAQASGHVCQNLYLACEAIEAGTCAITAYAQREMDSLLGVDGENEFVIYLAPVGKVRK